MKKSIGSVALRPSLLGWLTERLKGAPCQAEGADELLDALRELADGTCSSLLVELDVGADEDAVAVAALDSQTLCCGGLSIDARSRRVLRDGEELSLTPKEFDILYLLARNRGEVFTKEQIYQAVWENDYLLDGSNVMAFIRKLRKKVEPSPDEPRYILTIWGIGYKFNDRL